MERFPAELIYLILFAAFVVYNWLAERAARQRQREQRPEEAAEDATEEAAAPVRAPVPEGPSEYAWGRAGGVAQAAPAQLPVSAPPPRARAAPPPSGRTHPVRALLRDRSGLRRAVVLAMVLGPCRAQEPPERR